MVVHLGWVDSDLGSSPGWRAATVATYCLGRVVEHPKSKPTQPRCTTTWDALYNMEELSAIRTFLRLVCTKENLGNSERMYKVRRDRSILYDWCVLYLASQVTDLCDDESECF